jgi:hypothetical protein
LNLIPQFVTVPPTTPVRFYLFEHTFNRQRRKMKKQTLFTIIALLIMVVTVATGVSNAQADGVVTTDAIAGTWYGNMHFSDRNDVERIQFMIAAGCEPGSVCGSMLNIPAQCTWEITYDGFSSGAYQYHFSNTLKGSCPPGSAGSLTLLQDGTLYRFHRTPVFTATGILSQLPSALK